MTQRVVDTKNSECPQRLLDFPIVLDIPLESDPSRDIGMEFDLSAPLPRAFDSLSDDCGPFPSRATIAGLCKFANPEGIILEVIPLENLGISAEECIALKQGFIYHEAANTDRTVRVQIEWERELGAPEVTLRLDSIDTHASIALLPFTDRTVMIVQSSGDQQVVLNRAFEAVRFIEPVSDPLSNTKPENPQDTNRQDKERLRSASVTQETLVLAIDLIHRIYGSKGDVVGAEETYRAFVDGLPLTNLDPLERGASLVDYRLFYDKSGEAVGIGGLYQLERFGSRTFFLGWLGIAPEFRGKGYGRALIAELESLARDLGGERIFTHTPLSDPLFLEARNMYLSLGYRSEPYLYFYDPLYERFGNAPQIEAMLSKHL